MAHTWTTPSGTAYNLYLDMLSQPHLMIAGATGSGKSVVINALIYTAMLHFPFDHPYGAQFILIDPKRVELARYKELPHVIQYASEPTGMILSIKKAMDITETRYKAMQRAGEYKYSGGHVYLIIDEFADLMTTNKKQVQPLIQRLAQIGRAANVHIILATQCPLAKVIPTEIKVNFDARLGLRTSCAQDSRNILRNPGLECLPRYGKGIYSTPEEYTLYNIPMIPPEDISERIKWWAGQKLCHSAPSGLFNKLFGRK